MVRVYEKIGLDIRDQFESQLYIQSEAIGEQSTHLNKLKALAYCIGPKVIDIPMIVWARMKDRITAGSESIERSILVEPEIKQLL